MCIRDSAKTEDALFVLSLFDDQEAGYRTMHSQLLRCLLYTSEQRYQMGYLYLTQGIKSAVDYVKHIERERERKCRLYMKMCIRDRQWAASTIRSLCRS